MFSRIDIINRFNEIKDTNKYIEENKEELLIYISNDPEVIAFKEKSMNDEKMKDNIYISYDISDPPIYFMYNIKTEEIHGVSKSDFNSTISTPQLTNT